MLRPDGEIEHKQRDYYSEPKGQVGVIEQVKLVLLGVQRRGDRGDRHGKRRHSPQHHSIDAGNTEICQPAPRLGYTEPSPWAEELDCCHELEHADKDYKPVRPSLWPINPSMLPRLAGSGALCRSAGGPAREAQANDACDHERKRGELDEREWFTEIDKADHRRQCRAHP